MNQSAYIVPNKNRRVEDLLSGLIMFREDLGDIGKQLIDTLVSAGVSPDNSFTTLNQQKYLH